MNSDNFSFRGFDWLGYNDSRTASSEEAALREMSPSAGVGIGGSGYAWIPLQIRLEDGSDTIAFKMSAPLAAKFRAMQNSDGEHDHELQQMLLTEADSVLTTPSRTDRLRGMKPSTVVIRTPSSLIDLMDDQVPDLREGFFTSSQDSSTVSAFAGTPMSGFPWLMAAELAHALYDGLVSSLERQGVQLDMQTAMKIAKHLITTGGGAPFLRFLSANPGEWTRFWQRHKDAPIADTILDAFYQWMTGELVDGYPARSSGDESNSESGKKGSKESEHPELIDDQKQDGNDDDLSWEDIGELNPGADNGTDLTGNIYDSSQFYNSPDHDGAYVPLSYWRHLYEMGSNFRRRNAIPDFSSLAFTGDPATDLLLNRVPEIYIYPDGRLSRDYWQYGLYPLSGGLFKGIGKALKKVGSAVTKGVKAVAKGVSKVMDSPIGGIISAIPVVGNVANVAGRVASTINRVSDTVDAIQGGDSVVDETGAEAEAPAYTGMVPGVGNSLPRPNQSESAYHPSPISASSLPAWQNSPAEAYQAPTLSLITGDPDNSPVARAARQVGAYVNIIPYGEVKSRLEEELDSARSHLWDVMRRMEEVERRGPMIMLGWNLAQPKIGSYLPSVSWASGDPKFSKVPIGLKALEGHRCYWSSNRRPRYRVGTILSRRAFAGDPESDRVIREALATWAPGAEQLSTYLSLPSLVDMDPSRNIFVMTLRQMIADKKTKVLVQTVIKPNGTTLRANDASLVSFLFDPSKLRPVSKQLNLDFANLMLAAATLGCTVATDSMLSSERRADIMKLMSRVATSGAWTGRGLDQMVTFCQKGQWPSTDQLRDSRIARTWARLLSSAILITWLEAGVATASEFSTLVYPLAADADALVSKVLVTTSPADLTGTSDLATTTTDDGNLDADPDKGMISPESPSGNSGAVRRLRRELNGATREGDDDEEELSLFHEGNLGDDESGSRAPSFDAEASDYWAIASLICSKSFNQSQATAMMIRNAIPPFIINLAIQKFFPCVDHSDQAPCAWIPLSRKDYLRPSELKWGSDGIDYGIG